MVDVIPIRIFSELLHCDEEEIENKVIKVNNIPFIANFIEIRKLSDRYCVIVAVIDYSSN